MGSRGARAGTPVSATAKNATCSDVVWLASLPRLCRIKIVYNLNNIHVFLKVHGAFFVCFYVGHDQGAVVISMGNERNSAYCEIRPF